MPNSYPLTRRRFLGTAGAMGTGLVVGPVVGGQGTARAARHSGAGRSLPANLFTLGVASGEPTSDGVVLWTRLAPDPINGGGMPVRCVTVQWQLAADCHFRRVCARGTELAQPESGHSVHVEVCGLDPDREYFYRLRAGREVSPVGRTRTAPAPWSKCRRLRFAFASCQNYQDGFYTAHHHLTEEDVAFVAFLGDYIYESPANPAAVRQHEGTDEPYSLIDYRNRHAQYRSDPNLQAAHAAFPWIVTLDDHEVDNNGAGEMPQDPELQSPQAFRARRIAAFRAYYEHMPLRRASVPRGLDMQLYRRLRFGRLVSLHVLDTRQYRSPRPSSLAEEDVAFVAFLGDYIYESRAKPGAVRQHEGTDEPYSLVDYRNRHAQYRCDANLQDTHAAFPWIVAFDDHEVDNDWADEIPQDPDMQSPEVFRARRIAAFQAYYEHMPLRRASVPRGLDMHLYRRLRFGRLVSLHVLDTRQYRSPRPKSPAEANDPTRSMTGSEQEHWLLHGLASAHTRWNLVANQVMMASADRRAGPEQAFSFDNWDGYRVQRRRLLEFFGHIRNPVVLTGDRHATWVCDLKPDFDEPSSPVVGAEITGTSVSSGGNADPVAFHRFYDPIMAESPHWKYIDNRRGYVICDVTDEGLHAYLRVVSSVWHPTGTTVSTAARFAIEAGCPGISAVDERVPPVPFPRDGPRFPIDDDQM